MQKIIVNPFETVKILSKSESFLGHLAAACDYLSCYDDEVMCRGNMKNVVGVFRYAADSVFSEVCEYTDAYMKTHSLKHPLDFEKYRPKYGNVNMTDKTALFVSKLKGQPPELIEEVFVYAKALKDNDTETLERINAEMKAAGWYLPEESKEA